MQDDESSITGVSAELMWTQRWLMVVDLGALGAVSPATSLVALTRDISDLYSESATVSDTRTHSNAN